ncbi:MAG: 3-hydroxyacyl-CoA dehydrogenase family protein [Acidimicrobiales bacterium]
MNFHKVGVVGSGIMGSGIAEVVATCGSTVVLRSRTQESVDSVLESLEKSLNKKVVKQQHSRANADAIRARVTATVSFDELVGCDFIIETVVEDVDVKKRVFKELDRVMGPDTILATNTSTLSVMELATTISHPERVCGMHFFNPASTMTLVEIVRPLTASDETIKAVTEFALACGKEPVEVTDQAGFIVNALLFPYLNNAIRLLEQGVATVDGIDVAMKGGCGFPMGPFALLDLVGLDTSLAILDALHAAFGDDNLVAAQSLRDMVARGELGRKSGSGFYDYRQ